MNLIGHKNTKNQIKIALESAKRRNMSLPHMLFDGTPGCGKTTMAREIANTSETDFIAVNPEGLKDSRAVSEVLENLNHDGYDARGNRVSTIKPSILFLDEVHKLPLAGQETLGIAMENYMLDTGRANKFFWLPYFTIIGATTLKGNLSKPFLDRFKLTFNFIPYSFEESIDIVGLHSKRLKLTITPNAIRDIARRGRGTPRTMVSYLERVRDRAYSEGSVVATLNMVKETFNDLKIDVNGFNEVEIKILKSLYKSDKPVGLENLSIITNQSARTLKENVEPFLIQKGLIMRTGSGRTISRKGREYLDKAGYTAVVAGKIAIAANYERD